MGAVRPLVAVTDRATVRAGYDALGESYADQRAVGSTERALLARALAAAPDDPLVLDAGCGPGPVLTELVENVRAVGLDFSIEQLRLAATTAPAADLVSGDLTALPFPADRFDAAVSLGVLMHLDAADQATAIDEFARVLRPGARLLVSDGAGEWVGEHADWLGAGVTMTWAVAGIDAVAAELEAAGFELLARASTVDELAEDDDASQWLALAELPA